MKIIYYTAVLLFLSCNSNDQSNRLEKTESVRIPRDTIQHLNTEPKPPAKISGKEYSNKRFKYVLVERLGEEKFRVRGEGQIFEANFNWVVEDGHEELYKGFEQTDAGAPEWGSFDFTIEVQKKRANSTLTLVLFESSAMDGSRQHELPVPLD